MVSKTVRLALENDRGLETDKDGRFARLLPLGMNKVYAFVECTWVEGGEGELGHWGNCKTTYLRTPEEIQAAIDKFGVGLHLWRHYE